MRAAAAAAIGWRRLLKQCRWSRRDEQGTQAPRPMRGDAPAARPWLRGPARRPPPMRHRTQRAAAAPALPMRRLARPGHFDLPAECVAVIDTPEFQRLRELKQLGLTSYVRRRGPARADAARGWAHCNNRLPALRGCKACLQRRSGPEPLPAPTPAGRAPGPVQNPAFSHAQVYLGANHCRFEHSLGVAHLAGSWAQHLLSNFRPEGVLDREDRHSIRALELAGARGSGRLSGAGRRRRHGWLEGAVPRAAAARGGRTDARADLAADARCAARGARRRCCPARPPHPSRSPSHSLALPLTPTRPASAAQPFATT